MKNLRREKGGDDVERVVEVIKAVSEGSYNVGAESDGHIPHGDLEGVANGEVFK